MAMRRAILTATNLLGALAVAGLSIAGTAVAADASALSTTTVSINSGNVPTTAAATAHECSTDQGGGPFAGVDTWVFVLPGSHASSGDFVSLTAQFDTDGNGVADTTRGIPSTGGFLNGGPATSKAFLPTPSGWTLISATAVITGTADFFTLSHTCPAGGTTSSPPSTPTPSGTPSPSGSSPAGTPSTSGGGTQPGTPGGSLPQTGTAIGGVVVGGAALVVVGVGLLLLRRRADRSTTL